MNLLRKLLADNTGIATIEYAMIAMLLGTGLITSFLGLGSEVNTSFNTLQTHMVEANSAR
jgi:Flp pilus assembly pilin Flp